MKIVTYLCGVILINHTNNCAMFSLIKIGKLNYSFSATSTRVMIYLAQDAKDSIYVDFLSKEDCSLYAPQGFGGDEFQLQLKSAHIKWVMSLLRKGEITADALLRFLPQNYAEEIIKEAAQVPSAGNQF